MSRDQNRRGTRRRSAARRTLRWRSDVLSALRYRALASIIVILSPFVCTQSAPADTSPTAKTPSKSSPFVEVGGTQFRLHGRDFYVAGVNNHYLSWSSDAETIRLLDDAVAMGANVIRTFLGTAIGDARSPQTSTVWNFQATGDTSSLNVHGHYLLSFENGAEQVNEGATGLGRIDFLLVEAAKRNLKIILIILDFWKYGGGVPQMVAWRTGHVPIDSTNAIFFTDPDSRYDYEKLLTAVTGHKNHLTGVAYRDDPTIFSWELMNEPQAPFSIRNAWLSQMSDHLKKLDPHHLVGTGEDHFNIADFAMPSVDYVTWHGYPKYYGIPASSMDDLIRVNCQQASANGKPVLLEEFGLGGSNTSDNKAETYRRWLELIRADKDCAGWLIWRLVAWQDTGSFPADPVEQFDVVRDGSSVWTTLVNATERATHGRLRRSDFGSP